MLRSHDFLPSCYFTSILGLFVSVNVYIFVMSRVHIFADWKIKIELLGSF